jgi:F-type H+-transporting ATPase subunit a
MKKLLQQLSLGWLGLNMATTSLLAAGGEGGHELSVRAQEIFKIGPFPVTNSMVTCWIVCLFIVGLIKLMAGKPKLVPTHGQILVESVVDAVRNISGPIVGKKLVGPTFWLTSSVFVFIITQNWSGLFPGVGSIGMMDESGHIVESWIRPGNADLNMTLALACVTMGAWVYFILKYAGPKLIIKDIFGNKADKSQTPGPIFTVLFLIFFGVGLIELISICFRPVSLSFRLFGNVFGGESLLHSMYALGAGMPGILGKIMPAVLMLPFYFLETLIGAVQALVFMLLTSVYIGLICNHGDDHHH